MINTFDTFLNAKPLYYKEIDHERVHIAYTLLKPHIKQPRTIHIVGTNGKGSTGRVVAHLAFKSGLKVGHYTSPHILKFNERIWIDGANSEDEVLEESHQKLFSILGKEMSDSLSYFEYTTLLAFVVFENCDLMVLEAGLGGEFDATNVCDKELSIITPIGIDHQAFLGESIEEIASTKINSIQQKVLLAPQTYDEVVKVARKITAEKNAVLYESSSYIDIEDARKHIEDHYIPEANGWSSYLVENATVALQALEILNIEFDVNDLLSVELFGRFYPLTSNIRIDVGHNPLAAQAIVKAMELETVLIYNSLDDKDYKAVLRMLKPKVKRIEIIKINSQRAAILEEIEKAIESVALEYSYFNGHIDEDEHYLVFGSFYVVEEFLKKMNVSK